MAIRRSSQWARQRADMWGRVWFAIIGLGTVANVAVVATVPSVTGGSQLALFFAGEIIVLWASLVALLARDSLLGNAKVQDDLERLERIFLNRPPPER